MSFTVIPWKNIPVRNFYPAATCIADFDKAVQQLKVKPKRLFLKQGPGWYKQCGVLFQSGRYATLCQWEVEPNEVEIGLESFEDEFFYEEDLIEILELLNVSIEDAKRAGGVFTWIKPGEKLEDKMRDRIIEEDEDGCFSTSAD